MFGEKDMLGIESGTVDTTTRIVLPGFCNAEKDDSLVIVEGEGYIEIWETKMYQKYLDSIKENEFMYPDIATAFLIRKDVLVDEQRRIQLKKQLVTEFQLMGEVEIEGKGSFIRIWNKSCFEEYRVNLRKKLIK